MFRRVLAWIDPRKPGGVRPVHVIFGVPVAAIGAVVLALFIAGAFAVHVAYDAGFFRHEYPARVLNLRPPGKAPIHVALPPTMLPSIDLINMRYNDGIQDQDGLGACQCWAALRQLDYQYNAHFHRNGSKGHAQAHFSVRFCYSLETAGQDVGTYFEQDVAFWATTGVPRARDFNYPPYTDDASIPSSVYAIAAAHKFTVQVQTLYADQGAGPQAIPLIKQALVSHGQPVNIDLWVCQGFDNATQNGGNTTACLPGEQPRGGHAITIIGWDDSHLVNGVVTPSFRCQNQWASWWGDHGYCWLPYAEVETDTWGAAVALIQWPSKPAANLTALRHQHPRLWSTTHPMPLQPPPAGAPKGNPGVSAGSWYVGHIESQGPVHEDLGPMFNAAGQFWNIAPVGLAATYGSECALRTGGPACERRGYWPDVSGGGCQVTVATAGEYGVGSGADTEANIDAVFAWEANPLNCIWLEAHILHDDSVYRGGAQYAPLNILWNCGPATDSYPQPYGQCATNYYGDFLGWYNYSLVHWAAQAPTPPPSPKRVFPLKLWQSHTHSISPYYRAHRLGLGAAIWWNGHVKACGGVLSHETWHMRLRMMSQRFAGCVEDYWPAHPHWTPKVVRL